MQRKQRGISIVLVCGVLIFMAACTSPPSAPPEVSPPVAPSASAVAPAPNPSSPPPPTVPEPSAPLYLPLPVYEVFSTVATAQDELDSFLHRTAVVYYSMRIRDARGGDLVIPSLRLIDTWEAEDGDTYYLCLMATADFYDLARDIRLGRPYGNLQESRIGLGVPVRFKVAKTGQKAGEYNYWEYHCTEILEIPPSGDEFGGGNPLALSVMCEGRPDTLERLSGRDGYASAFEDDYIRDILPESIAHDSEALLDAYLSHFGFSLLKKEVHP